MKLIVAMVQPDRLGAVQGALQQTDATLACISQVVIKLRECTETRSIRPDIEGWDRC